MPMCSHCNAMCHDVHYSLFGSLFELKHLIQTSSTSMGHKYCGDIHLHRENMVGLPKIDIICLSVDSNRIKTWINMSNINYIFKLFHINGTIIRIRNSNLFNSIIQIARYLISITTHDSQLHIRAP